MRLRSTTCEHRQLARTILSGGSVLDVSVGVVAEADVVITDDRVTAVGSGLDADRAVDCTGQLLVPGFIDCHTHVALTQQLGNPRSHGLSRSALTLSAVPVLRTLLRRGMTTVRDAWGADAGFRSAIERGWIDGPQLFVSLRQVCTTGGIGDHWGPDVGRTDYDDPAMPDPVFDGPGAARATVRRMVRAGADWIKVTATGSLSQGARATDVQLTEAELVALVDEAARQGSRRVMVHAHAACAAELAARAGARSVEHGIWLDDTAVEAMASAGTWLVPTLSVTQSGANNDIAEAHRRSFALAVEAGVPIAMGTDNPVRPHEEVLREIEYMARNGLGAAGALRAATLDAARLLEIDDDRGEITAGKRADIVALNGTDIDLTHLEERITAVWHNGRAVPFGPAD